MDRAEARNASGEARIELDMRCLLQEREQKRAVF